MRRRGLETVPPSVEALLASRLDALEAGERALLERAAVVGRDFARSAVVHLTPPEELAGLDSRLAASSGAGSSARCAVATGEEDDFASTTC